MKACWWVFILIATHKKCNLIIQFCVDGSKQQKTGKFSFSLRFLLHSIVEFLNRFISFDMSQLLFYLSHFSYLFLIFFLTFCSVFGLILSRVRFCSPIHCTERCIFDARVPPARCVTACAWTFVQLFNLNCTWLRSWSFSQDSFILVGFFFIGSWRVLHHLPEVLSIWRHFGW